MPTSPAAEKLMTVEEYMLFEDPPGMESELVRGKVVFMPPPKSHHGYFADQISFALQSFMRPRRLGVTTAEAGFLIGRNPDTVRAPDVAFLARERVPQWFPRENHYLEGAPTLAVEVISDSENEHDIAEKIGEWLTAGAERVWEVRPRLKTVTVHRADAEPVTHGAGATLTSDDAAFAVAGFALPVADIFA
jgi:Uma2 family endonuclease